VVYEKKDPRQKPSPKAKGQAGDDSSYFYHSGMTVCIASIPQRQMGKLGITVFNFTFRGSSDPSLVYPSFFVSRDLFNIYFFGFINSSNSDKPY